MSKWSGGLHGERMYTSKGTLGNHNTRKLNRFEKFKETIYKCLVRATGNCNDVVKTEFHYI